PQRLFMVVFERSCLMERIDELLMQHEAVTSRLLELISHFVAFEPREVPFGGQAVEGAHFFLPASYGAFLASETLLKYLCALPQQTHPSLVKALLLRADVCKGRVR